MSVHLGRELSDSDIRRLEARWKGGKTLEAHLLEAYLAMITCWKCRARLTVDEHPNCTDCPDFGEHRDPEAAADG